MSQGKYDFIIFYLWITGSIWRHLNSMIFLIYIYISHYLWTSYFSAKTDEKKQHKQGKCLTYFFSTISSGKNQHSCLLEIFISALFWIMECTLLLLSQCSFCQATLPWVGGDVSQHKNRQLENLELYAISGIDIAKPFRVTFFEGDHLS